MLKMPWRSPAVCRAVELDRIASLDLGSHVLVGVFERDGESEHRIIRHRYILVVGAVAPKSRTDRSRRDLCLYGCSPAQHSVASVPRPMGRTEGWTDPRHIAGSQLPAREYRSAAMAQRPRDSSCLVGPTNERNESHEPGDEQRWDGFGPRQWGLVPLLGCLEVAVRSTRGKDARCRMRSRLIHCGHPVKIICSPDPCGSARLVVRIFLSPWSKLRAETCTFSAERATGAGASNLGTSIGSIRRRFASDRVAAPCSARSGCRSAAVRLVLVPDAAANDGHPDTHGDAHQSHEPFEEYETRGVEHADTGKDHKRDRKDREETHDDDRAHECATENRMSGAEPIELRLPFRTWKPRHRCVGHGQGRSGGELSFAKAVRCVNEPVDQRRFIRHLSRSLPARDW